MGLSPRRVVISSAPARAAMAVAFLAFLAFLAFSAVCIAPAVARADDAAEARHHYAEGSKFFNLGEFPHAVEEYKAAYKLVADPAFLFNIAQAYRLAGDAPQAIFFYRSYLRDKPNAPNRREVEDRIKKLEAQAAQSPHPATASPPAAAAVVPPPVAPPPTPPASASAATVTAADSPTSSPPVAPAPAAATGASTAGAGPARATAPPTSAAVSLALADQAAPGATAVGPTGADLKATVATEPPAPIYRRGWFWAAAGVVALVAVVVVVAASRGGGGPSAPDTSLGTTSVF